MCHKCKVAREIIRGDYGNGHERYQNLRKEGYDDDEIEELQDIVNAMLRAHPNGNIPEYKCYA